MDVKMEFLDNSKRALEYYYGGTEIANEVKIFKFSNIQEIKKEFMASVMDNYFVIHNGKIASVQIICLRDTKAKGYSFVNYSVSKDGDKIFDDTYQPEYYCMLVTVKYKEQKMCKGKVYSLNYSVCNMFVKDS